MNAKKVKRKQLKKTIQSERKNKMKTEVKLKAPRFTEAEKTFYEGENGLDFQARQLTLGELVEWTYGSELIRTRQFYEDLLQCNRIALFRPEEQILLFMLAVMYKTKNSDYQRARKKIIAFNPDKAAMKVCIDMYEKQVKRLVAAEAAITTGQLGKGSGKNPQKKIGVYHGVDPINTCIKMLRQQLEKLIG
jgi:hypothetical protein